MIINWDNKDWSYLLGVIHGDGHVSVRSVCIAVGYKEKEYAELIADLWRGLGYLPKTYRKRGSISVEVHNSELTNEIRKYKSNGKWSLPVGIDKTEWIAGVVDTDGCVSIASKKCAVIITLKRSGNLIYFRDTLIGFGISEAKVHNRVSKYNGEAYEVEEIRLTSFDNILKFNEHISLRILHKRERLKDIIEYINIARGKIPMWKQFGEWLLNNDPKTWEEIAEQFNLSKDQVDSLMENLKRKAIITIIPPPKMLTKYKMEGWKNE